MFVGVNLFYFLVSTITSMISTSVKNESVIHQRISTLYSIDQKYGVPKEVMRKAEYFCSQDEPLEIQLQGFSKKFSKIIKVHLDFYMYYPVLKKFPMFKKLDRDVIAGVGKRMVKTIFVKGTCRSLFLVIMKIASCI
jgi:hypothetical protein